jgi:hypothetical protein
MGLKTYQVYNGPRVTTAAPVKVTTGTAIKTLLQLATPSTEDLTVVEWGISFDASAAATPIMCELVETDVAATVTAYVANDIVKLNRPNDPASLLTLGTSASGYTATAEGTITATRSIDTQLISPTINYVKQWPQDLWPTVAASKFLRVRVTAPAAVNAICYINWAEG